ncbi:MAG TPA: hypothetical protein VGU43_05720 [Thermoplasmata archaeon]|nr:hypothetical protein [Thermoplasmata archaeon]
MRRGLFGAGLAVAVIGVILLLAALAGLEGANVAQSTTIPQWTNYETISINTIGSGSLSVSWSGGSTNTQVYLAQCTNGPCSTYSALATGHGSSGSISSSISSGSYRLWENFTTNGVSGTYTVSGITLLEVIGFLVIAIGAVLIAVGALLKAKPRLVYQEPEQEDLFKVGSSIPGAEAASAVTPTKPAGPTRPAAPAVEYRPERPEPPRFMKASEPYTPSAPSPNAQGDRPMRICSNCGTSNEPWITNCRNCKRPLSQTG